MINNSSLQKWNRLAQKQLDQQFLNKIAQGLECSPFEAQAILETVHDVFKPLFETSGAVKPGQLLFQVAAIEAPPDCPLSECRQTTVLLTLDAGQQDLDLRKNQGVVSLRRHRLQRLANEAFQQGGLLTVEDIAYRLLNCGQRTICRDLAFFKSQNIALPLRSTIKDMGRAVSHRALIVEHWLKGKEYEQIKKATFHSIASIENYIGKFKRVIALANQGFDIRQISFLAKVSPGLAEQYFAIYKKADIVSHRKKELDSFFKKNNPPAAAGRLS